MNWTLFNTYSDSPNSAFETLCNHLFYNYIFRNHPDTIKFRVVNGSGGDGGIEAYAELANHDLVAVQSKWFREGFGTSQIDQIRNSVKTALSLRPAIKEYIICMPLNLTSLKYTKGKTKGARKVTEKSGDQLITELERDMKQEFKGLKLTWWLDDTLDRELLLDDNEGLNKYWFTHAVITFGYLEEQFSRQRLGWLHERYTPKLHAQGIIQADIAAITYSEPYRRELLRSADLYLILLQKAITAIKKYAKQEDANSAVVAEMRTVRGDIEQNIGLIDAIAQAIRSGDEELSKHDMRLHDLSEVADWLIEIAATFLTDASFEYMLNIFQRIKSYDFRPRIDEAVSLLNCTGLLILCGPGTGKTHGLAFAVEQQLEQMAPGLIVQAFGTLCDNWTTILGAGLNLTNWNVDEILNALGSLALRHDRRLVNTLVRPGEELDHEPTKVLICVDGLEEDSGNWKKWNDRIRESIQLGQKFKRVKFIYSARPYFYKEQELPATLPLKVHELPKEGDVPFQKLALEYFKPQNYNITITSPALIRGIDSLFALRLFCEAYRNQSLNESDQIITAGTKLLARKIVKMNEEFQVKIGKQFSEARDPIGKAIIVLAGQFLEQAEIEHEVMVNSIAPEAPDLTIGEVDLLLDYLAHNGILVKKGTTHEMDTVPQTRTEYFITYRSIIEIVIANRIIAQLVSGAISEIPAMLMQRMRSIADEENRDLTNERITQIIVNTMFHEHGKLIGEDGFLVSGFGADEISRMQLEALRKAPAAVAARYKKAIDDLFWGDYRDRYNIMVNQILPASESFENNFGALYLHDILINQPDAYTRDQMWNGPDRYEGPSDNDIFGLQQMIHDYSDDLFLSEYALHHETPLIYAWCLSTLNQEFRDGLRKTLTYWALKQPYEFCLLCDLIFNCKDPQIQEDLAAITLALAGRLKDQAAILNLAQWALSNVFKDLMDNRNVMVRYGFRAIVERANQYGLITDDQVELSRPKKMEEVILLRLDEEAVAEPAEEIYPIMHDLAWYVIGKASDGFLEIPDRTTSELKGNDSPEAEKLLEMYHLQYGHNKLYADNWAMAAAIGYVRSLGFDRVEGNDYTDETHGSKSKLFTYEEKYTWLAVHYLKGYLADYVPYKKYNDGEFITDYSKITNVPNPGEEIEPDSEQPETFEEWVQDEPLFETLGEDIATAIVNEVMREPEIDFSKWLHFKESQFYLSPTDDDMLAIRNYTSDSDPSGYVYGRIDANACFIRCGTLNDLLAGLADDEYELHFVEHLDGLHASPDTQIYSNPSDVVWMNWIDETEKQEQFYSGDEIENIAFALTKMTKNTIQGEKQVYIPSKLTRNLTQIVEMDGQYLLDKEGNIVAFLHMAGDVNRSNQELVIVKKKLLETALELNGLQLIWFVHLLKSKEHGIDATKDLPFSQKSRKYIVYQENGELNSQKFWDERVSNHRDRYAEQAINALVPEVKAYNELSDDEISQIETLIISGGEVNEQMLPGRLKEALAIATFKYQGKTIIGVAAIKQPLSQYTHYVFKQAKCAQPPTAYHYELGYVVIKPRYRGHHLARRLCEALFNPANVEDIFATTRTGNHQMHSVFTALGFQRAGDPYLNKAGTSNLSLYLKSKFV